MFLLQVMLNVKTPYAQMWFVQLLIGRLVIIWIDKVGGWVATITAKVPVGPQNGVVLPFFGIGSSAGN